jgi:uncharacterized protein
LPEGPFVSKLSHRQKEYLLIAGAVVFSVLILYAVASRTKAGPPRKVTFAAGSKDGAYYKFAEEYAKRLQSKGLEVTVLETGGSLENLRLLKEKKADIGFVQSGLGSAENNLSTLGSMFLEPLWLFTKTEKAVTRVTELFGKRVAIGDPDSGTREVALAVLGDTKMVNKLKTVAISGEEAKVALLEGKVDAAFYVGSPSVKAIRELATSPEIQLADFERAQAYARYHSSLSHVTLYAGMLDLSQDIPAQDKQLLASAATLVVTEDFHYALVTIFLQTARDIHQQAGAFQSYGEFPSPRLVSLPLVPEAEQFYRSGPSFFFRHLPFFWAATVDRLLILLLPFLTLLLPLIRFAPPFYGWLLKRQLLKKQEVLQKVEINEDKWSQEVRLEKLRELKSQLPDLKQLPPAYQNDVFLMQLRLERVTSEVEGEEPCEFTTGEN